jgi:hypothetical protein
LLPNFSMFSYIIYEDVMIKYCTPLLKITRGKNLYSPTIYLVGSVRWFFGWF